MPQMTLKTVLQNYKSWLVHRDYSCATIEKYTHTLARFFTENPLVANPLKDFVPTREAVMAWRDHLSAGGYAAATVNAMLAGINEYQESIGNPAGKAKPLKRQRRVFCDSARELTKPEYFRLLKAARETNNKRTQLLLETICSTGIRVSELQYITVDAIRNHRASIRCKGKCRDILLPAALCHRLQKWCRKQHIHMGPAFKNRSGGPLSRVTVWKLLKALCSCAQVAWKKVFPHNLRHLFAKTFYELDKNLSKLADVLGHSSIETTRIYIMESGVEHERLLNRMHLLL